MSQLEHAVRQICAVEPLFVPLADAAGLPALPGPERGELYQALVRSVVYQQLNGRAAETIFGRFLALFGARGFPSAKAIAEADFEALRGAGLSRSKAASIQDIARRARAGELPTVAAAAELDDEELVRRLTVARGVGRWTAEMVLMFRLGRLDVMPATDFGVRKGFGRLFGTGEPSEPSAVIERAERWRPYRSVASWYLWRATEIDLATLVGR